MARCHSVPNRGIRIQPITVEYSGSGSVGGSPVWGLAIRVEPSVLVGWAVVNYRDGERRGLDVGVTPRDSPVREVVAGTPSIMGG